MLFPCNTTDESIPKRGGYLNTVQREGETVYRIFGGRGRGINVGTMIARPTDCSLPTGYN